MIGEAQQGARFFLYMADGRVVYI